MALLGVFEPMARSPGKNFELEYIYSYGNVLKNRNDLN
jgi:hypothetical protein